MRIAAAVLAFAAVSSQPAFAATHQTLRTFCPGHKCSDGAGPHDLVMDQAGHLYGTTMFGGAKGFGTVYRFIPSTGEHQVLHDFCSQANCADGKWPYRVKLVLDQEGSLYGTASQGGAMPGDGGVVFRLTAQGAYDVLHTFCADANCTGGGVPAGLTYAGAVAHVPYDGASPLFGIAEFDGAHGRGAVWRLKPTGHGWEYDVLHAFCAEQDCPDGTFPVGPIAVDAAGDIHGATEFGGAFGQGAIYKLRPRTKAYSVRHSFCAKEACPDGSDPQGGVVLDGAGDLYGTASAGGAASSGTLFKLASKGRARFQVLARFGFGNGVHPLGLTVAGGGMLYGTTLSGGASQHGVVFRYDGALSAIYDFCSERRCADGEKPLGALTDDGQGHLIGAAEQGGHHDAGTLYEITP